MKSDSIAPPPPIDLALELIPQGIKASWDAPTYNEPVSFSLYRSSAPEITSIDGLTPLITGIPQNKRETVDPNPSRTQHSYVLIAVDEAGNMSEPSNSGYLNVALLPVSGIAVTQTGTQHPVVAWTHPDHGGDIAGYDVYLGPGADGVKLNTALIAGTTFIDAGYTGDERTFTIVAQDANGAASLGRSIVLPRISAAPAQGASVKRGVMNRLDYEVTHHGAEPVDDIRLRVMLGGHDHATTPFSLAPGETRLIPVTVAGHGDLPDIASLETTIDIIPNAGESVKIIRAGEIPVGNGLPGLRILNEEFTRGGSGPVRFVLENTGAEEIEIITAKNFGKNDSDQITWFLLDEDENIVFAQRFKQAFGASVLTHADGTAVARIPAGATFTSDPVNLPVPPDAPDRLTVMLSIADIHHHYGKEDAVSMEGVRSRRDVALIETSYTGTVASVVPQTSFGDQPIVITGRAVGRTTDHPVGNAPLHLIITLDGFERKTLVITDAAGNFTYSFTPKKGEAGRYAVCAVHLDLLDRPVQQEFVVSRVYLPYAEINLKIPWNYYHEIRVKASAGPGTTAANLRMAFTADDQVGGILPPGIHVIPGEPLAVLESGQSSDVAFTVWADNQAPQTGSFIVNLISDENPNGWCKLKINTHFIEASPALYFTPNHLETGVKLGQTVVESVTLENKGVVPMEGVSVSLGTPDGSPPPAWAYLALPSGPATLDLGDKHEIGIHLAPPATTPEGDYTFILRVSSDNHRTVDIYAYAAVTQSGTGTALIKVSDIFTGTLDGYGNAGGREARHFCVERLVILSTVRLAYAGEFAAMYS